MRVDSAKLYQIAAAALLLVFSLATLPVIAAEDDEYREEDDESAQIDSSATQKSGPRGHVDERKRTANDQAPVTNSRVVRRFHAVLDELLAEFGYDVKLGQIKGLSNIAIRKVRVSNAIPRTYEEYIETLVIERIRENSQVRVIDCIPCKTKTSSLVDGKLMITSPATNLAKLDSAATTLGIENFMDVILVYHTTHMVLAVNVFNSQSKETVWARSYNSETLKSRFQKMAVDYSQVEPKKITDEYAPEYRLMVGLGGASIPNLSGKPSDSAMLNLQIRSTEKFNNRHNEVGLLLSINYSASKLVGTASSSSPTTPDTATTDSTTPKPNAFRTGIGLYAFFSYLFTGQVESYNDIRTGLGIGLGTLVATGYLAPAARVGIDFYLGRRFSLSFYGNYIRPASVNVNGATAKVDGGRGADVVFSTNW
jgi:hypothetical protein